MSLQVLILNTSSNLKLSLLLYYNILYREFVNKLWRFSLFYKIKEILSSCQGNELITLRNQLDTLEDITSLINKAIVTEPPFSVREGGMIAEGYDNDVDELRKILGGGKEWLEQIAEKEREATGIKTLKIGNNRVFGYYIEVSKSFMDQVPPHYIRKQTLAASDT